MDLTLIQNDFRALKGYIVADNDVNNWDKIIILYNIYLFFNHVQMIYYLMDYIQNDKLSFGEQFKTVYLFFFLLCNLRNSYMYFILNVSNIDKNLGDSFYNNTSQYFM
jgi:hypothetical protein